MSSRLSKTLLNGELTEDQLKQVEELEEHPVFSTLSQELEENGSEWMEFLHSASP